MTAQAVAGICEKGDEKAIAVIAHRLEDSDGDVRRDAVHALVPLPFMEGYFTKDFVPSIGDLALGIWGFTPRHMET